MLLVAIKVVSAIVTRGMKSAAYPAPSMMTLSLLWRNAVPASSPVNLDPLADNSPAAVVVALVSFSIEVFSEPMAAIQ